MDVALIWPNLFIAKSRNTISKYVVLLQCHGPIVFSIEVKKEADPEVEFESFRGSFMHWNIGIHMGTFAATM